MFSKALTHRVTRTTHCSSIHSDSAQLLPFTDQRARKLRWPAKAALHSQPIFTLTFLSSKERKKPHKIKQGYKKQHTQHKCPGRWAAGEDTPPCPQHWRPCHSPESQKACTCGIEALLAGTSQHGFIPAPTVNTVESISVAVLPPGGLVLVLGPSWCPENSQGRPQNRGVTPAAQGLPPFPEMYRTSSSVESYILACVKTTELKRTCTWLRIHNADNHVSKNNQPTFTISKSQAGCYIIF